MVVTEKALTLRQRTNKGAKERLPTDVGRLSITTHPIYPVTKVGSFFYCANKQMNKIAKMLLKNW